MNTLSSLLYFIGTRINKTYLVDTFYPIGSYYETSLTTEQFNPNTAWGGTWVLDSVGKVTVSMDTSDTDFDTLGETGGSKYVQEHSHAFTQPKTPNHTHTAGSGRAFPSCKSGATMGEHNFQAGNSYRTITIADTDDWYSQAGTASSGGGVACTDGAVGAVSGATTGTAGNLQPYIVVNRWHRTA